MKTRLIYTSHNWKIIEIQLSELYLWIIISFFQIELVVSEEVSFVLEPPTFTFKELKKLKHFSPEVTQCHILLIEKNHTSSTKSRSKNNCFY